MRRARGSRKRGCEGGKTLNTLSLRPKKPDCSEQNLARWLDAVSVSSILYRHFAKLTLAIPPIHKPCRHRRLLPLLLVQRTDARIELLPHQQIYNVAGGKCLCVHARDKTGTGHVGTKRNETMTVLTARMHSRRKGHHRA